MAPDITMDRIQKHTESKNFKAGTPEQKLAEEAIEKFVNRTRVSNRDVADEIGRVLNLYSDNPALVNGLINGIDRYFKSHTYGFSQEPVKWNGMLRGLLGALGDGANVDAIKDAFGMIPNEVSNSATAAKITRQNAANMIATSAVSFMDNDILIKKFVAALQYSYKYVPEARRYFESSMSIKMLESAITVVPPVTLGPGTLGEYDYVNKVLKITGNLMDEKAEHRLEVIVHEYYHSLQEDAMNFQNYVMSSHRDIRVILALVEGGATFASAAFRYNGQNNGGAKMGFSDIKKLMGESVVFESEDPTYRVDVDQLFNNLVAKMHAMVLNADDLDAFITELNYNVESMPISGMEYNRYAVGVALATLVYAYDGFDISSTLNDLASHYTDTLKKLYDSVKHDGKNGGGIYDGLFKT